MIIEIIGGLGNQMFQYAFYYRLKKHYNDNEVKIYLKRFAETNDNQGYELENVFGINIQSNIYDEDATDLIDDSLTLISRLKRKLFGRKKSFFLERIFKYDAKVFNFKRKQIIFFRGLWQDESYFKDLRLELLELFQFKINNLGEDNMELLKKINNSTSVSIHIRRGDYVSNEKYNHILGGICTYDYYKQALDYLQNRIKDTSLFIFSDDIIWVKNEFDFLSNSNITFVNHNKGAKSYIDMYLMSQCQHNIIANSSFSWWGAWLNKNESKIVIAPEQWFKNNPRLENNNVVPNSWIKIKS